MINKITIEDKEAYYRLGSLINKKFEKLYELEHVLDSEYDSLYGYYKDNKLVGFIHIMKMYENVDIVNIVVDSDYRRRGIGSKLIDYIIHLDSEVTSVMLEVNEHNMSAIKLYEKNGFVEINKRPNYYGNETAIIMKRDV